jgi:hypothetical protein
MLAVKPRANLGASGVGNTTTLYQEKKAQPMVIYSRYPLLVLLAVFSNHCFRKKPERKQSTHHSTGGEALGLVVVLHDKMHKREDHGSHTGAEAQQKPGGEFQTERYTPDSEAYVTKEQNETGEGERHPDWVNPVRIPMLTGRLA